MSMISLTSTASTMSHTVSLIITVQSREKTNAGICFQTEPLNISLPSSSQHITSITPNFILRLTPSPPLQWATATREWCRPEWSRWPDYQTCLTLTSLRSTRGTCCQPSLTTWAMFSTCTLGNYAGPVRMAVFPS